MLECRTAEDVREARRRNLEWRKRLFPPPPKPIPVPKPVAPPQPTREEILARLATSKARVKDLSLVIRWLFNITEHEWHADRRSPQYVFPHWVAIYVAAKISGWSLTEIGRQFKRDHTSVIHTIRKLNALRGSDESVDHLLTWLESDYVD